MRLHIIKLGMLTGLMLFSVISHAGTGSPGLLDAVKNGDRDTIINLVKAGADVNQLQGDGTTSLFYAVHSNDLQLVELLLSKGADTNITNKYGATALYVAARDADDPIVEKLLAAGAKPNIALMFGETPLMAAVDRGRREVVRLLLSHGADPNARETSGGQTGLMWAAAEKHSDIVSLLIENGADVNAHSNEGFTPLFFAAQQGDVESSRAILAAGGNIDEVMPKSLETPLIVASASNFAGVASLLLENGANTEVVDSRGNTPLHLAARHKKGTEVVKVLLQHGADPNARLNHPKGKFIVRTGINMQGATPFLLAAISSNLESMQALIDAEADPLLTTVDKTDALFMMIGVTTDPEHVRFTEYLVRENARAVETAKFLVALGLDVKARGPFGWTALHLTSYYGGKEELIKYLVEQGADVNARDDYGQTPISIASAFLTQAFIDDQSLDHAPTVLRPGVVDLLLALGATPLEQSGVVGMAKGGSN